MLPSSVHGTVQRNAILCMHAITGAGTFCLRNHGMYAMHETTVPTPPENGRETLRRHVYNTGQNYTSCAGDCLAILSSMSFATSRALPLTARRGLLEARLKRRETSGSSTRGDRNAEHIAQYLQLYAPNRETRSGVPLLRGMVYTETHICALSSVHVLPKQPFVTLCSKRPPEIIVSAIFSHPYRTSRVEQHRETHPEMSIVILRAQ